VVCLEISYWDRSKQQAPSSCFISFERKAVVGFHGAVGHPAIVKGIESKDATGGRGEKNRQMSRGSVHFEMVWTTIF